MSRSRKFCIIFGVIFLAVGIFGILFTFLSNQKFKLDDDQFGTTEFVQISGEEYDKLAEEKKSFLVFVDQDGCITADGLEKIATEVMKEKNVQIYRLMFSEMRKTKLHDSVRYYPSLAIIHSGEPVIWLKADADEDVDRYKDKNALENWLNAYIEW